MAVWPFIVSRISKEELGGEIIRHEKIHFRQQLEMFLIPFFIWYTFEYFYLLSKKRDKQKAYLSISFEMEAYQNEEDPNYLKRRKLFSWIKYLRHV